MASRCKFECGYANVGRRLKIHEISCTNIEITTVECRVTERCFVGTNLYEFLEHYVDIHSENVIDLSEFPEPKSFIVHKSRIRNKLDLVITQFNTHYIDNEIYLMSIIQRGGVFYMIIRYVGRTHAINFIRKNFSKYRVSFDESETVLEGNVLDLGFPYTDLIVDHFILNLNEMTNYITIHIDNIVPYVTYGCHFCESSKTKTYEICDNGHKSCSQCFTYDIECRKCFEADLEKAVGLKRCKYENSGCKVERHARIVKKHEVTCLFQDTSCGIGDCNWIGTYKTLQKHFREYHRHTIKKCNVMYKIDLTKEQKRYFKIYNQYFILTTGLMHGSDYMFLVHQITPIKRSLYFFIVKLYNSDKSKRKSINERCIASTGFDLNIPVAITGINNILIKRHLMSEQRYVNIVLSIVLNDPNKSNAPPKPLKLLNPSGLYTK